MSEETQKTGISITPKEILSTIDEVAQKTGLKSFVLFGSSSIVAFNKHRYKSLPDFLRKTVDLDIATTFKGQSVEIYASEMKAISAIFKEFGEESDFFANTKFSVELASRGIVGMAPQGWEDRTKLVTTEQGIEIFVLNPIDCATLKLEVGRAKDIE